VCFNLRALGGVLVLRHQQGPMPRRPISPVVPGRALGDGADAVGLDPRVFGLVPRVAAPWDCDCRVCGGERGNILD